MAPAKPLSPPQSLLKRADRQLLIIVLCLLLTVGATGSAYLVRRTSPNAQVLGQTTIAVGAAGAIVEVVTPDALVPGTRALAGLPESGRLAQEQLGWLAAGTVPQVDGVEPTMITAALLDLHVLSLEYGVPVAGQRPAWRYVWPRDSALAAVALARTGHPDDAERVLTFLERVQPESGVFAARYRPDGSGEPDARGVQLDGVGWALWAMAELTAERPAADRIAFLQRHRQLLDRSAQAALAAVGNRRSLPPVSADYWEVPERRRTLSTAALIRAGLESAGQLYGLLGDAEAAQPFLDAEQRLSGAIRSGFGRDGYPRRMGGRSDSVDLGAAFLLPPFGEPAPDVEAAWRQGAVVMRRPAGGLAPGGSWRRDGVSWTNITATYAMTAAGLGDRAEAKNWLGWLAAHRTTSGSLPEKVLADGSPASVVPLAWTAAATIIAADELG
jgi:hypothetical protein